MRRALPSAANRRWLICWTLSALLAVQWLATWHGVVHAIDLDRPPAAAQDAPSGILAGASADLAGDHEVGTAVCQLLDQFCHGSPLPDAAPMTSAAAPREQASSPERQQPVQRQATRYDARAPPSHI